MQPKRKSRPIAETKPALVRRGSVIRQGTIATTAAKSLPLSPFEHAKALGTRPGTALAAKVSTELMLSIGMSSLFFPSSTWDLPSSA